MDAHLSTNIALPPGQYLYHSLRLTAEIPLSRGDGLSSLASGLSIELAEDSDNGRKRYIQNVLSTTNAPGYSILPPKPLSLGPENYSLRLRYDANLS